MNACKALQDRPVYWRFPPSSAIRDLNENKTATPTDNLSLNVKTHSLLFKQTELTSTELFILCRRFGFLISHSAELRPTKLKALAILSSKWLLSINSKKTKVLIFQKKCRKSALDKHYFQTDIKKKIRKNCKCPSNGNFNECKINSKGKRRGSLFCDTSLF